MALQPPSFPQPPLLRISLPLLLFCVRYVAGVHTPPSPASEESFMKGPDPRTVTRQTQLYLSVYLSSIPAYRFRVSSSLYITVRAHRHRSMHTLSRVGEREYLGILFLNVPTQSWIGKRKRNLAKDFLCIAVASLTNTRQEGITGSISIVSSRHRIVLRPRGTLWKPSLSRLDFFSKSSLFVCFLFFL